MGHRISHAQIPQIVADFMENRRREFGGWSMELNSANVANAADVAATVEPMVAASDGTAEQDLADLRAAAEDLGLTPGQIAGRLLASKKWEQRAKKADAETATVAAAQTESLVDADAIREQARADVQAEHETALAETALRGRLQGHGLEAEAIESVVTTLTNGLRGVIAEGRVDTDKVNALVSLLAPNTQAWPDMGQGNRGGATAPTGLDAGRDAYQRRRGNK